MTLSRPKRILIVEDDSALVDVLVPALEEAGYEVHRAPNGAVALGRLDDDPLPEVILLDLRMPVMDGWAFRSAQRRRSRVAAIPVVAMSADGTPQAEAISADAFLLKPFSSAVLLETIARVLSENERDAQEARREHLERLASLGRLAASVGHEINNPLAFVSLNIDLASDRIREVMAMADGTREQPARPGKRDWLVLVSHELTTLLRDAQTGLQRIRGTVQHLQILGRKSDEGDGSVDIERVLDESIAIARSTIHHRAVLEKVYGEVPAVKGRATALGQVCLNLLINSAQAIPEGDVANNKISVTTSFDDPDVIVEIQDTGRGIPVDVLPQVFDAFFTTKSGEGGTGLGLAVCQQIVAEHGGRLEIDSEPGHGTRCRLLLKASGEAATSPVADGTSVAATDHRRRILVIDDETMIGHAITRLLARHDVTACENAGDAFGLLERGERFDVVLCDLLMPNIGGAQVFKEMLARWPALVSRLAFMTGGVSASADLEFLARAGRPILQKPFTRKELEELVGQAAGESVRTSK